MIVQSRIVRGVLSIAYLTTFHLFTEGADPGSSATGRPVPAVRRRSAQR